MGDKQRDEEGGLAGVHAGVVPTPDGDAGAGPRTAGLPVYDDTGREGEPEAELPLRDAAPRRRIVADEEKLVRAALIQEHHIAFGIEIDAARLRVFANDTLCIPAPLFKRALRSSRQAHIGNFPPPPGLVIKAARDLDWANAARELYVSADGSKANPRWYQEMLRGGSSERPKEIGERTGPKTIAEAVKDARF